MTQIKRNQFIYRLIILITCVLILMTLEYLLDNQNIISTEKEGAESSVPSYAAGTDFEDSTENILNERYLICKHTDIIKFYDSIQNPREFILNGKVAGGIVPHHLAAATLISGFFNAVAESIAEYGEKYDTVVIIAPNHEGETGDIVVSFRDWQLEETIYCDRDIIDGMYNKKPDGIAITQSDDRMEEEHSVSVLIPYINHYLPETKVAAFLLSRRLTLENIYNFSEMLSDEITASGKKVLFIGSIDFSHYLPVSLAEENDRITEAAILDRNFRGIQEFSNNYVDSPQALNTFLMYMQNTGADNIDILYNTDMSEFYGEGINETTSYFFIAAYMNENCVYD